MKKLLFLFGLIVISIAGFSQNSLVNGLQVKNQGGVPSASTPGSNGGIVTANSAGVQVKTSVFAAIGSRARQVTSLNDSILQVITDSTTYTFKVRGTFTASRQGWFDSVRSGQILDTTYLKTAGAGTSIGYVSLNQDSIILRAIKDSSIRAIIGSDSALRLFVVNSGVTAGTYGNSTNVPQIQVGADGRVISATNVPISSGGGGPGSGVAKKTQNSQAGTTYTLSQADSSTYITTSSASAVTITIPDDATAPIASPVNLDVYQLGPGKVTFAPLNGNVSLSSPRGKFKTVVQYSKVTLNKLSSNNWVISGDLDTTSVAFISTNVTSVTGLSSTTGTASTPLTFHVFGGNLTANINLTAPTNFEISKDNVTYAGSASIIPTGGSVTDQLMYVRIANTAPTGNVGGNIGLASTGAAGVSVAVAGTVGSTPTITPSGSLASFSTTQGTASTTQSFTFTAINLTASVTWTAGTGMEVSTNGTTFASTAVYTQSSGSASGTVFVRIAAATTAGSYSGNIVGSSTGATPSNVAYSGTVASSGISAAWNLSKDPQTVTGFNNLNGNPNTGLTSTDATTGWTCATTAGQWDLFAGQFYGSDGDGGSSSGGAYLPKFPSAAVAGTFLNIIKYGGTSTYGFQFTGLPAGNYTLELIGSIKSSVITSGTIEYDAQFGTAANVQQLLNVQDNTQTTVSWTGTITAGQTIKFGIFQPAGGSPAFGVGNAFRLTKN